jgi:hypothetical protein
MHSEKTKAQQTADQEQQKAKVLAESQKAAAKSKATEQQKSATDLAAGQKANAKTSEALGKTDSAINSILGK